MLNFVRRIFKRRTLEDYVESNRKTVYIEGVRFIIRRINPYDWATGSNAAINRIATWTEKRLIDKMAQKSAEDVSKTLKQVEGHLREVILAGTVRPKLSAEDNGTDVCVDEILRNPEMANRLYSEIVALTFQKKKSISFTFQRSA